MSFAPEYVKTVLNENFEDAKALFLEPLLAIHGAHLVMLAERDIVTRRPPAASATPSTAVCRDTIRRTPYDGSCEDLFFFVERLIVERGGDDVAGRLHTARSRNDIDMTMYRMRQRGSILDLFDATLALRGHAGRHRRRAPRDRVPGPHAHAAGAADHAGALPARRHRAARTRRRAAAGRLRHTNRTPLGACAITGTGFPIDRDRTSALLGFDGPTGNTYGSIATVDYLLESVSAASVALVGLGRVVQDLLLWCTAEFGYLRLGDGFVQVSSIMPQKRNPVALEHARAIGSKALGQAQAVMLAVHNTPFGDIVDTEDDLQPLVRRRSATRCARSRWSPRRCDRRRSTPRELAARAGEGWHTVTELADTLVREHGLPFCRRTASPRGLIEASSAAPERPLRELLVTCRRGCSGAPIAYMDAAAARDPQPAHFVSVRETLGGPAPEDGGGGARPRRALRRCAPGSPRAGGAGRRAIARGTRRGRL